MQIRSQKRGDRVYEGPDGYHYDTEDDARRAWAKAHISACLYLGSDPPDPRQVESMLQGINRLIEIMGASYYFTAEEKAP